MEPSNLIPFVRENLEILFVGLNPARGSSRNRHYFSVNQAFWNQLYDSGLILSPVDKSKADQSIFGSTKNNFHSWSYGITDLVTAIAESDSRQIKPGREDCRNLACLIQRLSPKAAILLHGKVLKNFLAFVGQPVPRSNSGRLGRLIAGCPTEFFNIAFPHGNAMPSSDKVAQYREVKRYLEALEQSGQ